MKILIILLVVILCCVTLTSCKSNIPAKSDFAFSIVNPVLEPTCGETIVYKAELKNNTSNDYTLSHGIPLITIYIYTPGQKPEDGVASTLLETKICGSETISKELSTKFTEPGEYMLRSYCSFSIEGEDFYYELEDCKIIVNE